MRVQILPAPPTRPVTVDPGQPTASSRSPWRPALHNLLLMMRNVVLCGVAAIATAFLTSRGNVFSSLPPAKQSRTTFMVANLLATQLIGAFVSFLIISAQLMSHRFLAHPTQKPSFLFCLVRVGRGALPLYVGAASTVFAVGLACSALPPRVDPFKLEYYLEAIIGQAFATACEAYLRRVVRAETVKGLEASQRVKTLRRMSSELYSSPRKVAAVQWLRTFLHRLPSLLSFLVAGGFIHATSHKKLTKGLQTNLFVGGSLVLKLIMQAIAKHYLLKGGVTSFKRMCIIVSVPTVLIDTQARLAILGLQDTTSTLNNCYVMAIVELLVRLAKVAWLRTVVKQKRLQSQLLRTTQAPAPSYDPPQASNQHGPADPQTAFPHWRDQVFTFHAAEAHADMYAEYIAIVCSAAIAAFWSTSPQYTIDSIPANQTPSGLVVILVVQVGIELVVDFLASTVEISSGVKLQHTRGLGPFLGMLFGMLTVVNINMSAVMYVRSRDLDA